MRPYHILLIDDDFLTLKGISINLKRQGYQVKATDSGETAFELLEKNSFDLVLTDLVMEPIDGFQILVKAKQLNPQTKVIIITGYGVINSVFEAHEYRADDYLLKPMDIQEIIERVKNCIEKREKSSEAKSFEETSLGNFPNKACLCRN